MRSTTSGSAPTSPSPTRWRRFWARDRALTGPVRPRACPPHSVRRAPSRCSAGRRNLDEPSPPMRTWPRRRWSSSVGIFWQQRFGGRPDILGTRITLDREPFEVIGVMNRGFEPAYVASDLWTPLGIHEGNLPLPAATYLQTIARLRPGATVAQLDAEVRALMADIVRDGPPGHRGWTAGALSFREFEYRDADACALRPPRRGGPARHGRLRQSREPHAGRRDVASWRTGPACRPRREPSAK